MMSMKFRIFGKQVTNFTFHLHKKDEFLKSSNAVDLALERGNLATCSKEKNNRVVDFELRFS